MRIKDKKGDIDSLDHCWDCLLKKSCAFLKKVEEESKGIQIIIIQYCSECDP